MAGDRTRLSDLAALTGGRAGEGTEVVITDVVHDSRQAGPGALFVAVVGFTRDGHDIAPDAVDRGAAALCVERPLALGLPELVVRDTRAALGPLAAAVHGHPSRRLTLIGVTGTNGKTTVTHMLESVASAADIRSGRVGTTGASMAGRPVHVVRTTPEASDLQRLLAEMVDAGVALAAIEVSSHALALGRVEATWFEVVAFTNLSQDHLDFHPDMEAYFAAKSSLFTPARAGRAVIWVDDPWGRRLAAATELPVVSVGTGPESDVTVGDISSSPSTSSFVLRLAGDERKVRLPLGGRFNVANAAVAAACAQAVGVDVESIVTGLEAVPAIPGRLEPIDAGQLFAVLVDYAHTPDGIDTVVGEARSFGSGRVIVVVGAGGDRDQGKRSLMGRAAGSADVVVVTSDNPRSEPPEEIVAAVAAGARGGAAEVVEEVDRRSAIRRAVGIARRGDVVLILGKGHEQGQELAGRVVPFDDRVVAREELGG